MNRKTLVITLSILIAVCIGMTFYAEWEKKRFDASLPKSPAAAPVVETTEPAVEAPSDAAQSVEETPAGHWHGDEWHATPHTAAPEPVHEQPAPEPYQPRILTREERLEKISQRKEPRRTWGLEGLALRDAREALRKNRDSLTREEFERQRTELAAKREALYFKMVDYDAQQRAAHLAGQQKSSQEGGNQ